MAVALTLALGAAGHTGEGEKKTQDLRVGGGS
jgi:hypothetical protein